MVKYIKEHLLIVIVLFVSLVVALSLPLIEGKNITIPFTKPLPSPTVTVASLANEFSYKGEEGKDALTILQAKAKVELAPSGLVVGINNRKADEKKHEFWAFYVNDKLATVGPADYQTKETDMILWKIDTY